jgi:hypothetical protein
MTRQETIFSQLRPFKMWTNALYMVPLVLALQYGLYVTAVLCLAVAVFGLRYHFHHEGKRYLMPDQISSLFLIGTNLGLCYAGGFKAPYFYIALLFLGLALFYNYYLERKAQYSLNHGMWHLYGALVTMFCIFTYVL